MKRIISTFAAVILVLCLLFTSCGNRHRYYNIETELGDTFCLEVYLSGNMHGMWPHYLIYDSNDAEKKNGSVLCVIKERDQEGKLPDNPVSSITAVGSYGSHNFYKVFDMLFYYQKGVYMGSILDGFTVDKYEQYKKGSDLPEFAQYCVQAISDLMKSHNFEYIIKYGEIPASDKDPEMKELLIRYASGDFSKEELQQNAESGVTEASVTDYAQHVLEKYYAD